MKKTLFLFLTTLVLSINLISGQSINHWETAVYNNDIWKYFEGTSEPDAGWRTLLFNDSFWKQGPGGIGYSDNDDNTVIPSVTSLYIRHKFNITDTAAIEKILFNMDYDDAFVAYLNDTEIARSGITGVHPAYNQTGADHEATMYQGGLPESFYIEKSQFKSFLINGENILAIQIHNSSLTSSDMSSNAFLSLGINNTSGDYRPVPAWFSPSEGFSSSNLPLVVITTRLGESIIDQPKITVDLKIIHHQGSRNFLSDSGNVYTGKAGIEIRGTYSATLPQKPYSFETRTESGSNRNVSLLGMPSENDWVLIANYNDKTFLRNVLAFDIFRKMGNYAPAMKLCEVILNDEYQGIYLLGEKIKIDKNRVNINSLSPFDNYGDDVTGGYIIKNDYYSSSDSWKSNFSPPGKPDAVVYFVYSDPKPGDLSPQQKNYISAYFNSLETALYSQFFKVPGMGYKNYIDIKSFADYFILSEVTRNVDAYKKSRFFFKNIDSRDELLHSGPPWDFDWAWRDLWEDCIHMNKTDGSGWAYKINECDAWPVPPSWEVRMLQDNDFANLIYTRYYDLRRTILNEARLNSTIDSVANLVNEAQKRHFQKWQILGINAGTPEQGSQPLTYNGEVTKLKTWISTRLAWLDANLMEFRTKGIDSFGHVNCFIYPNPVSDKLTIIADKEIKNAFLFNSMGKLIFGQTEVYNYLLNYNISNYAPGIYLIRIEFSSGEILTKKVVKN